MRQLISRLLPLVAAVLFVSVASAPVAHAQARPTPAQAQELLRTRPDLIAQLQQRLRTSGLTPDQVRARLRAEGYPESILDAYLPGGSGRASTDTTVTSADLLGAVRALGIVDSTDADILSGMTSRFPGDTDSLGVRRPARGLDSLMRRGTEREDLATRFERQLARDSGTTVYGLDVFRGSTTQFDANAGGPVDASYRLGPGDRLVLILTGDVELAHTLDVTREGFVVIPQVGQLYVANLTLAQLEDLLYSRLGRVYSGVRRGAGATTRFSISVARLRSNQIFVVGDVQRPGNYRVSSAGSALTALYAAGGPTEAGSLRRIDVRRAGRTVSTLDVYDYLLRGDATRDVRLENGDVLFVPVHLARVRVVGEVLRPATYEMLPTETLADVIRAAGGFAPSAVQRRVQIERIVPAAQRTADGGRDRVVIDVSTPDLASAAAASVPIQAGDVIRVFRVASRVRNRIAVTGNVWTPGAQGFVPGMTVSQALRLAGGAKGDTYLGQVLVSRLRSDSTRMQLRATLRDTLGAVVNDFPLQEDDEIRVFSVSDFRPPRYVAITGAVRKGGQFAYREGMTVRDLVLLAGGLEESAFLGEAEVARLPEDRRGGATARTFRVALDSSYLFERGLDGHYLGAPGLPAPSGNSPDVALVPYDNVLILRQPDWQLQRTVVLTGEVRFPGRYALKSKNDRITDAIQRAGGLTREAYAEGVTFYRTRSRIGRIGVDLPAAMRQNRHRDNLLLQDGDSINVPLYNAVVNVTGAVNSPVAVSYVPGRTIDYYIDAAGGGSRNADLKRAYVQQPSGKVESRSRHFLSVASAPKPRPGSSVTVPELDPKDRRDLLAVVGSVAQVLASLVAIVAVVRR